MNKSNKRTARFSSISWAKVASKYSIAICGIGGIGSWLSLFLNRIGYSLTLIDFDTIEEHNLGGQLFSVDSIDQYKVSEAFNTINRFGNFSNSLISYTEAYEEYMVKECTIVVCAFDKMGPRKQVLKDWKARLAKGDTTTKLLVDGRMSAEQFEVFFVTPDKIEAYEKTLFDDSEVEDALCTNKATSHFGAGIAFEITRGINNFVAMENDDPRLLPFHVEDEGYLFKKTIEY